MGMISKMIISEKYEVPTVLCFYLKMTQEIFQDNPSLQTGHVMKQLLEVYKDGR